MTRQQRRRRWEVWGRLRLATPDGTVKLDRRRVLQTPRFGVYLHRLAAPDAERDVHDHPWAFVSLVLRGGYTEQYAADPRNTRPGDVPAVETRYWRRGSVHYFPPGAAHRVVQVAPRTLTLCLVGRSAGTWRFWTATGPVSYDRYRDLLRIVG